MYKNHFGITAIPFDKNNKLISNNNLDRFQTQFIQLVNTPGIGILTGEPGVGKTAAIRNVVQQLNPQTHKVLYLPESHFTSYDIYRQFANELGLNPGHRFADVWRNIKYYIKEFVDIKCCRPILIIDEAQSLNHDFLRNFPSFLNYEYDARDMMTVWFIGLPVFLAKLRRNDYASLASRIRVKCTLTPITDYQVFMNLINQEFKECGCNTRLISDSGIDILRTAANGSYRTVNIILKQSLMLAYQKNLNHIPDEIITEVIAMLAS